MRLIAVILSVILALSFVSCTPAVVEDEGGAFEKLINAIINFFRGLLGLPKECVCGEELE